MSPRAKKHVACRQDRFGLQARRLQDNPATLEELARQYDVSRERIRQIEVRAFEKVQDAAREAARADA